MSENPLAQLLQLEQQIRRCESLSELSFIMVNGTRTLVDYDQAAFLFGSEVDALRVIALSDTPVIDRTTPFVAWLEKGLKTEDKAEDRHQVHSIDKRHWSAQAQAAHLEFSPPHTLWVPLCLPARPNQRLGVLWFAKGSVWTEKEIGVLKHLASSYGHALQLFSRQSSLKTWPRKLFSRWSLSLVLIALALLLWWPVRLSVLAPAEIRPKDPAIVTAPLPGAIKTVLVSPGQWVTMGEPLVEMEDTEFRGAVEIAARELDRVTAELKTAQQAGFVDRQAQAKVAELSSLVKLKQAEKDYSQLRLAKTRQMAPQDGLVVIKDPQSWQGRPVVVGEKILTIANPEQIELQIMLPVQDAISLKQGAQMLLFLDTDPLNPLTATLRYSEYEPELTPEQIMAYKVVGEFDLAQMAHIPRIGLRGTVKLYGEQVTLFYYIFRRPITALRQWLGW